VTTAAVILAAGGGTRWQGSGHKLLAPLDGRPVVVHAITHAAQAHFDELIVIDGAVDLSGLVGSGVTLIHNPDWRRGQGSSLSLAIEAIRDTGHVSLVVGLGDQPFLTPEAWTRVATNRSAPIAVATYDGARAQPVRLDAEVWDLLDLTGDHGARTLVRERPDLVVEVPCSGNPADIDTVGDLHRWTS
jgi:CTP:molybdopterin cytidylyltransferase MocA